MVTSRAPAKRPAARGRSFAAALFLALLGALAACRSAPAHPTPDFQREIEAQNRALEELFRTGNLLGIADLYTEDAALLDARGERSVGREEIDAYWSAIESPVAWRLESRVLKGSAALAYQTGKAQFTTLQGGLQQTVESDFLMLWRREPDGAWRIALHADWVRPAR